jgi:hypothetical protein
MHIFVHQLYAKIILSLIKLYFKNYLFMLMFVMILTIYYSTLNYIEQN